MPRHVRFLPLAALVALAGVLGWQQGWLVANLSEGDVIAAYSARYVEDRRAGGSGATARPEQCRAAPSEEDGVWLIVACGPVPHDPALGITYHVDRFGALVRADGPRDL